MLTVDDVDALLASAARRPAVRVMRDGEAVDASAWTAQVRLGGRTVPDVVDPGSLARALHAGATVVLQSLHRTVPAVGRFAAALEAQVSHPVQVNAYLTPPGSAGLAAHADGHDVLAVQLHGAKRWWVDGLGERTLEAGDVLYLPTGTRHRAETTDRSSLHLTVGIIPVTYRSAVQRLLQDVGSLDAPLPLGYASADPAVLERGLADAIQDAAKALVDADPAAAAGRERRRRRPRPRHEGHVASVARLDGLGADTTVRLREGPRPSLDVEEDGRLRLDLVDRVVHLPAGARAALDLLLTGAACRVGDLPELTPSSREVVARRLVVEGMLLVERTGYGASMPTKDTRIVPDADTDAATPAELADELGVPVSEVRRVLASMDPGSTEDDAPPMSPEVADNVRQHLAGGMQGGVTGDR